MSYKLSDLDDDTRAYVMKGIREYQKRQYERSHPEEVRAKRKAEQEARRVERKRQLDAEREARRLRYKREAKAEREAERRLRIREGRRNRAIHAGASLVGDVFGGFSASVESIMSIILAFVLIFGIWQIAMGKQTAADLALDNAGVYEGVYGEEFHYANGSIDNLAPRGLGFVSSYGTDITGEGTSFTYDAVYGDYFSVAEIMDRIDSIAIAGATLFGVGINFIIQVTNWVTGGDFLENPGETVSSWFDNILELIRGMIIWVPGVG